jgi:hypothetical protein
MLFGGGRVCIYSVEHGSGMIHQRYTADNKELVSAHDSNLSMTQISRHFL